jgi:hypothetical protein
MRSRAAAAAAAAAAVAWQLPGRLPELHCNTSQHEMMTYRDI